MSWGDEDNEKILSHEYLLKECEVQRGEKTLFAWGFVLMVLVTVGILALLGAFASDFVGRKGGSEDLAWARWVLVVLSYVVTCFPLVMMTVGIVDVAIFYRKIEKRQYVVYDDVLIGSSPSELYREGFWEHLMYGSRYRGRNQFYPTCYFSKTGRLPVGGILDEGAQKGDRFYVILLKGKKQKLLGVYAEKIYRWQGDPTPIKVSEDNETV